MPVKMVVMIFWKQLGTELKPRILYSRGQEYRMQVYVKTLMWVTKAVRLRL